MKKSKVPITVFFIICTVLVAVLARLEEIAQFNAKLNEKRIKEEEYLEEHTYLPYQTPVVSSEDSTIQDDVQNAVQLISSSLDLPNSTSELPVENKSLAPRSSDSSVEDWSDVKVVNSHPTLSHVSHISDSDDDWDDVQPIESKSNPKIESDDDWDDVQPIESKSNVKQKNNSDLVIPPPVSSQRSHRMNRRRVIKASDSWSNDDWDDVQPMNKSTESKSNSKIKSDDDWDDVQPIVKPTESKSNSTIESDDDWDDVQPTESKSNPKIESDDDWDDIQPNPSPNSSKIESVKSRQNPPQLTHRRRNKKLTVDMKLWSKTLLDGSVSINDQTPSATSSRDSRNCNPDSKESESGDSASVESTSFNSPKGNKAVATALSTIPDFDFLSSSTLPLFS